ncbi:zinc finger and BTB domain-containing protein 7C [Microcaecilia unicolor]|uniref:Zinc finger and BTB domain-containing protein 7C n=1 Tax=Microcaecilia unicolor TaxID=1415580 RepID=A0A6P7XDU6_9AMPH|nr:zinc finger and BTB domain-containing protein 7C [Microcaecilia unicolor]XP_030048785.1 zinc finger and BTB domain-containing protein 7C [Microcaecilia unicolor]XP_030048786.1 zinc finger and BTB domain-containing protein 7C [Microcaecilia unicolor]XP_030048787.1 zinc finger and BTB domain-containing protein 7C [Microcaecilia unicolor]
MAGGADDLIGIPFPNHSSEVLCGLNEQRQDGLFCDVILIVQDQEYRTHRSVLAACSKYFKKLFTASTLADQPHVYEIDFVKPEALSAILEFAYTSTLTITTSNVKHILSAAEMLEIQCIIRVCLEIMETNREADEEDDEKEEEEDEEEEEDDDDDDDDEEEAEDFINQENQTDVQDESCHQSPSLSDLTEDTYQESPRDFPNHYPVNSSSNHLGVIRDFSIESLLKENLYPKSNIPEVRPALSQFAPGFFPHIWNGDFGTFPQLQEQQADNAPLDLVIKDRKIKEEEENEELPAVAFHHDFFKEMFADNSRSHLGHIKAENDYTAYLNFLSATHLGGVFPPWPLEEERRIKPKASQQCPICNKVIMGAGKLPRHMRTHTGEKPYMCSICEVRFTRQDKLKIHMRKHTGERPYICVHCNAKFVHNYDLKNHLRIHTGVRPYQCEFCYKSFTRSDHLHRHIKRQSCRISRPRRGRKPAAWRAASLLFAQNNEPDEKGFMMMPPTFEDRGSQPSSGAMCLPGPSHKHFMEEAKNVFGLQDLEHQFGESQMKLVGRTHLEAERNAGIFAFALAHSENISSRQYFPAADPWNMGLNNAASISEASN